MTASCNTITISIHALRKESDMRLHQRQHDAIISIHALRKESDNDGIGGAFASPISIHALRKESDLSGKISSKIIRYFNPRSP